MMGFFSHHNSTLLGSVDENFSVIIATNSIESILDFSHLVEQTSLDIPPLSVGKKKDKTPKWLRQLIDKYPTKLKMERKLMKIGFSDMVLQI